MEESELKGIQDTIFQFVNTVLAIEKINTCFPDSETSQKGGLADMLIEVKEKFQNIRNIPDTAKKDLRVVSTLVAASAFMVQNLLVDCSSCRLGQPVREDGTIDMSREDLDIFLSKKRERHPNALCPYPHVKGQVYWCPDFTPFGEARDLNVYGRNIKVIQHTIATLRRAIENFERSLGT